MAKYNIIKYIIYSNNMNLYFQIFFLKNNMGHPKSHHIIYIETQDIYIHWNLMGHNFVLSMILNIVIS